MFFLEKMRQKKTQTFLTFNDDGAFICFCCFVISFFLFLNFSSAQPAGMVPNPPGLYPYKQTISKRMAIVLTILVCFFIFLAIISIYTRQCADPRLSNRLPISAASHDGNDQRSRRQTRGLDAAVIATFPTFVYSNVKGVKIGKGSLECAVCLSEFDEDDDETTLRLLPKCSHVFHSDCIDVWLVSHSTCPVCRASLVPKPGDISFAALLNSDSGLDAIRSENETRSENEGSVNQVQVEGSGLDEIRPVRARSTGWRLRGIFPRSHSTGHSIIRVEGNEERYTLRLPEEVRNELMNANLNRARSCVVLPRIESARQGYRTRSGKNIFTSCRSVRSDRRMFLGNGDCGDRSFTRLRDDDNDGQSQ